MTRRPAHARLAALALTAALTALSGTAVAAAPPAENSCVDCHQSLVGHGDIGERHKGFFESAHYRNGIMCDACHSGDSSAETKQAAHAGVLPAADPKSTVYFKNVPRTCGRCHTGQLAAFTQSRHFRALAATGRGPNCVTCHGSMALRVLKWNEVRTFCANCHNERMGIHPDKPAEAEATLQLMDAAGTLVAWAERAADGHDAARVHVDTAQRDLDMARTAWHTFDLPGVRNRLESAVGEARDVMDLVAGPAPPAPPAQSPESEPAPAPAP